jgi:hypothetical protein
MSEEPKSVVYYELRDTITQLRRENEIMKKYIQKFIDEVYGGELAKKALKDCEGLK